MNSMRTITKETKEQRLQRLKNQHAQSKDRAVRSAKKHEDEQKHTLKMVNIFKEFGVDYLKEGHFSLDRLEHAWDGADADKVARLSDEAKQFLKDNFQFTYIKNDWGRAKLKFLRQIEPEKETEAIPNHLLARLVRESGQPLSVVKCVYEGLVELTHKQLARKRHIVLPGLGRFSIRYRPALPERTGRNPKTGEAVRVPPTVAQNRVRIHPSKTLREWVTQNIEIKEPAPRKHHKKEKKRRKKSLKYTRYFDEQKHFHLDQAQKEKKL